MGFSPDDNGKKAWHSLKLWYMQSGVQKNRGSYSAIGKMRNNKLVFGVNVGSKWTRVIMILIIENVSVFILQLLFSTVSMQWSPQFTTALIDGQQGHAY